MTPMYPFIQYSLIFSILIWDQFKSWHRKSPNLIDRETLSSNSLPSRRLGRSGVGEEELFSFLPPFRAANTLGLDGLDRGGRGVYPHIIHMLEDGRVILAVFLFGLGRGSEEKISLPGIFPPPFTSPQQPPAITTIISFPTSDSRFLLCWSNRFFTWPTLSLKNLSQLNICKRYVHKVKLRKNITFKYVPLDSCTQFVWWKFLLGQCTCLGSHSLWCTQWKVSCLGPDGCWRRSRGRPWTGSRRRRRGSSSQTSWGSGEIIK